MTDKKTLFILIFIAGCFWLTAKYNSSERRAENSPSVMIVDNASTQTAEVFSADLSKESQDLFKTDVLLVANNSETEVATNPETPAVISESDQATLITREDAKKSLLKQLVLRVFPKSTPEEIDVWQDELGDLEPEMALGILQLRKNSNSSFLNLFNTPELAISPKLADKKSNPLSPVPDPEFAVEPELLEPDLSSVDSTVAELSTLRRIWKSAQAVCFHNLERMDCPGYKQVELNPYSTLNKSFTTNGETKFTPENSQIDVRQGEIRPTEKPLDFAIEGQGWFALTEETGRTVYTRNGHFSLNENGDIVQKVGNTELRLDPVINFPPDCNDIQLLRDGTLMYTPNGSDTTVAAGQLILKYFPNPRGLTLTSDCLYQATNHTGDAVAATPRTNGAGTVIQGCLERSNVNEDQTLEQLKQHQRQWEAGLKAAAMIQSTQQD